MRRRGERDFVQGGTLGSIVNGVVPEHSLALEIPRLDAGEVAPVRALWNLVEVLEDILASVSGGHRSRQQPRPRPRQRHECNTTTARAPMPATATDSVLPLSLFLAPSFPRFLARLTFTWSQFCIAMTSAPSTIATSMLLRRSSLSSLSAAILNPSGLVTRISHSINLASLQGGMTTLQAFLVILMPNLKLSSLFPLKLTIWSIGKFSLAEG